MNILITAGPTREAIDPVRFLSNRSTGKMGYALARAAREAGHTVILVSGPVALEPPAGVAVVAVESASDMACAVKSRAPEADLVIMAAAVADYRPRKISPGKLKKQPGALVLELERTEDILASLGQMKRPGQILVGFAAETDDLIAYAAEKLARKNLDWIAANLVGVPGRGFAADDNAVTLLGRGGERVELALQSKMSLAREILAIVTARPGRTVEKSE